MTRAALAAALAFVLATTGRAAADGPSPDEAPSPSPSPVVALRVHGELVTGAVVTRAAGRTDRRFTLDRAELGAAATIGDHATAELVLEAVRSAAPDSAAGIDGNSLLARVKRAAVGARRGFADVDVEASLGLVADPWLAALADAPLRTFGVTTAEEQGLVASSDLGVAARASYRDRAALALAVTNGEGAHQDERNPGKDTSVVATVRAPTSLGAFALHLYGRDGSAGPASVRSHRAGAALAWHHPRGFAGGAELVRAWGVGERGDVTAWTADVWADLAIARGVGWGARWDQVVLDAPAGAPDRWRATAGLWLELDRAVRVIAAAQLERAGADAPIAGVPAATDATRVLLLATGSFTR